MPEPQHFDAAASPSHRHRRLPWRTPLTLLTTACLVAACAQLPDTQSRPELMGKEAFALVKSLQGQHADWPG